LKLKSGLSENMNAPHRLADILLAELAYLLRPMVSALIKTGVTAQEADTIVRQVFVQMAIEQSNPETASDSSISIATGLARREVKRLRDLSSQEKHPVPENVSIGSRVVAAWLTRSGYQDSQGMPILLPRRSNDLTQPTFENLADAISKDVRPRAMLDELIRLGVVEINENDFVTLNQEAFVPTEGIEEKAFYLGNNLHDHAAAAFSNLLELDESPWFERSVHYKNITSSELVEIRKLVEKAGSKALKDVNQHVQNLSEPNLENKKDQKFTFGIYYYSMQDDSVNLQEIDKS
jgi:hypothetical protein